MFLQRYLRRKCCNPPYFKIDVPILAHIFQSVPEFLKKKKEGKRKRKEEEKREKEEEGGS